MIKILIHKGDVRLINYKDKRDGSDRQLRAMEGYAFTVNAAGEPAPFPEKFEFLLERDQPPVAPGEYTLHPSSFYVDRQNKLALAVRLAPVKSAARPATTA